MTPDIHHVTGLPLPPSLLDLEPAHGIPLPLSYEAFTKNNRVESVVVEEPKESTAHNLSWPQYHFLTSTARYPAMVAGYGSGKTEAGVLRAIRMKLEHPDENIGYYLPTYDLIKQIVFPRIQELLLGYGYKFFLNETDKELIIYGMKGKFIFRTMDKPERIIGYEHAHAIVDELDTLKTDKAKDVWLKIVARNRQKMKGGVKNTIGVVTTPEGFKFTYQRFKKNPLPGSQIIKASTYSNSANLPVDYIQNLRDNYPAQMLEAYLNGEFVNLTAGAVYLEFDRELNAAALGIGITPTETLHIGVDFNVGQMAAVVHILRENNPCAVDEFVGYLDTPALIIAIKQRYPGRRIMVYPDASGKSRKTVNASESDIALLRAAGFVVLAKRKNPFVKDRIAAFNKVINIEGKRVYKINVDNCPHLVEGLETQAYDKNGDPDKTSGVDHVIDAAGYFITYRYPITVGKARQFNLTGT